MCAPSCDVSFEAKADLLSKDFRMFMQVEKNTAQPFKRGDKFNQKTKQN